MMKRIFSLLLVMALMISVVNVFSYASDNIAEKRYEKGMACFESGDYDTAFSFFLIAGEEKGYAPAQNMLGICYLDGLGTEQNLEQAERYFKIAADQGYSEAALNLTALNQKKEKAYQDAINLYFDGKYVEAQTAFEVLLGYGRSEHFLESIREKLTPASTPTPTLFPAWTPAPTPISSTPTPFSLTVPSNPASPYGKALKENIINGVYYSDAQKVKILNETHQNRKNSSGKYRSWYFGTYKDNIYPGYRVELYYADGMLFFAVVTQNSKNQVTLYYWGDQIVACHDLRGSDKDLKYDGSSVYAAVSAEFGNLYAVAQQYVP